MRLGDVVGRTQLLQAAYVALELAGAVACWLKPLRRRRGRDHRLHPVVVKGVDQRHEAARLVALFGRERRDAGQHEGVVEAGDGEVVARPERLLAEFGKGETGDAAGGQRHGDEDRKSGVEGKSVSGRVDLGGRRIIKKNKKKEY